MELVVFGTYGEKLGHVDGKGEGLYVLKYDHNAKQFAPSTGLLGKPQLSHLYKNPTYLTCYRGSDSSAPTLYVVDEREDAPGTVSCLSIDEATGELKPLGPTIPAAIDAKGKQGAACCHVNVSPNGQHVMAANYVGGSLVAIGRNQADGSLDPACVQYVTLGTGVQFPGPNAARQEGSHAHMCLFSSGTQGSTLLVADLGSDLVWSIPFDETNRAAPLGTPVATGGGHQSLAGGGPRHMALHPTKPIVYVGYELTSQVAAFAVDPTTGALQGAPLCVSNAMNGCKAPFLGGETSGGHTGNPAETSYSQLVRQGGVCSDKATSIAAVRISLSGSHLIVSNRLAGVPGALSAIPLDESGCFGSAIAITGTLGRTPRDFAFIDPRPAAMRGRKREGAYHDIVALAANQDTDEISLMVEGGEPRVLTTAIPTPVCICMVGCQASTA